VKGLKTTLISAIAIGLLAGSVVGVAAQDEEAVAATPVEITGSTSFGGCSGGQTSTADEDGVVMARGEGRYCNNPSSGFTDPRLQGQFRVWQNNDAYPGGLHLFMTGFSMHDDEGAWVQRPSLAFNHPDGANATKVIFMDGQGAYDGLTLVAEVGLTGGTWDWHGYIIDRELPPAPIIELPE
jgi:hypothetical protein